MKHFTTSMLPRSHDLIIVQTKLVPAIMSENVLGEGNGEEGLQGVGEGDENYIRWLS